MNDWIRIVTSDNYEEWVRSSAVARITVDKSSPVNEADRRCCLWTLAGESVSFHYRDIAAIASAAGIERYGAVESKAEEADLAPQFKIGDRFFVVNAFNKKSGPDSFVLDRKERSGDAGNVYLHGSDPGSHNSGSFLVEDCYPTWNDVAKAYGVEL